MSWGQNVVADENGAITVKNTHWDTNSLSWVKVTGSTVDGSNVKVTNFPSTQGVTDAGGSLTVDSSQLPAALTGSGNLKVSIQEDAVGISGGGGSAAKAVRIDDASSTITYVGTAAVGSAVGSAVWAVKKLDTSSGLVVTWADGNSDEDNIWNNRASLTYS